MGIMHSALVIRLDLQVPGDFRLVAGLILEAISVVAPLFPCKAFVGSVEIAQVA
jgi:hypothetical protein